MAQDQFQNILRQQRRAAEHAEVLDGLIDDREDDLAELLIPIRDFLLELAGRAPRTKEPKP